ncbi:sigma factor-like helix-turn-helix DNA-binding protein [Bacillus sp. FJAT-22090]|uniref:sigma factor-like helix-turn-helix DNA-binding protein n=1 Tax=Bacillus sp. FJAT-22090 TaxID=1581038 RepID=UPI001C92E6FE|nr:sigma factor-like helix-turn-helix DNA-binding protein [Bacillus sp. FJAT-22090]
MKENTLYAIHQEIRQLREPYAEIFLLRTTLNLSFKEIGDIFERSENWARVTYYRAKCKLAERMDLDEL